MVFQRKWESCCPHVWDSWVGEDGVKWIIKDIIPEDDEEAITILEENQIPDETLSRYSKIKDDPVSTDTLKFAWRYFLSKRMSLGCYQEKDGISKLVGLNVCFPDWPDRKNPDIPIEGRAIKNLLGVVDFCKSNIDPFKILGMDVLLEGIGLVVRRDYRGSRLGAKILAARERLCLHHGIKGSSTMFTGKASQKCAERVGYSTIFTMTLKDLAEAGLDYPEDENTVLKVMVKKFECDTEQSLNE